MSTPYSQIQSVFLMNMAANGASGINATQANLEQFLAVYLNGGTNPDGFAYPGVFPQLNSSTPPAPLQQLWGAPWQVVWGPCVYLDPRLNGQGFATNAMYVAYSASQNTFVAAIAATDPESFYDWILEDGNVDPKLAVSYRVLLSEAVLSMPKGLDSEAAMGELLVPSDANVSAATALGISHLLVSMTATATPPNQANPPPPAPMNIATFLRACESTDSTLIFTGHSLAGALSPSLAATLYPLAGKNRWQQVLVLPTAGATPGNASFANWFKLKYPPIPVKNTNPSWTPGWTVTWNTDTANGQDVVPHAWDKLTAIVQQPASGANYPSIWGYMNPATGAALYSAVQNAISLSTAGGTYPNYYQALTYTFGIAPFAEQPSTATPWPNPPWGKWEWAVDTAGAVPYPPAWKPMPQYTEQNPLDFANIGDLILATHIDQYFPMFGVMPMPKMQPYPAPKPACKICAGGSAV